MLVISVCVYMFILGDVKNFKGYDPKQTYTSERIDDIKAKNHPVEEQPGHLYGTIYKGGFIVPILIGVNRSS